MKRKRFFLFVIVDILITDPSTVGLFWYQRIATRQDLLAIITFKPFGFSLTTSLQHDNMSSMKHSVLGSPKQQQ